jgi:hypothetical protein
MLAENRATTALCLATPKTDNDITMDRWISNKPSTQAPIRLSDAAHRPRSLLWALFVVFVVAVVVRIPLWLAYEPVSYPDTGTYLQAAKDLVSGDHSLGQGRRTPGYPLVIAAAGGDAEWVLAFQLLSGVATAMLMAGVVMALTGKPTWAAAAGLVHALNLQQLFQEGALLTESTATLAVAVCVALLIGLARRLRNGQTPWMGLLALGLLCAYALFVRPQFICLLLIAPAAMVFAASGWQWPTTRSVGAAALVLGPAVLAVLAWCALLQAKTGYFTLSTQSGFGMVNHPIDYIELAPPQYAPVRDVLIKVRDERIAQVGHSRNTIWYAWPEIQRVTGWTLPEASRQLQAMCRQLFIEHPWRYARSVASAWVDFWTVPFFWKPEQVNPTVRSAVEATWWVQHKLLRLANLAFVLVVAAVCVWPAFRRRVQWDVALSAIAATVLMSSLIQALADQGASSRYHLPTQSLVVLVLLVVAARWWSARQPAEDPRRLVRTAA